MGFPFGKCTRSNRRPENVDVLCYTVEKKEICLAIVRLQTLISLRDILGLECLTDMYILYNQRDATYTMLYCIKNQQDATLAVLFISNCKITLHVSDAFCVHHHEY